MKPITIIIPATGVATEHGPGKFFLCTATNGAFTVRTSAGDEYDFSEPNSGFSSSDGRGWGTLTFYNRTAAPVTVIFQSSDSPIKLPDVAVANQAPVSVTSTLTNTLATCADENENELQVTASAAAAAFIGVATKFRRAILIAQKNLDRIANTGNVYIGVSAGHQPILLAPGDTWIIEADTGAKRNFANWFISADNVGDGVSILFV
jgi:hypothetical protein